MVKWVIKKRPKVISSDDMVGYLCTVLHDDLNDYCNDCSDKISDVCRVTIHSVVVHDCGYCIDTRVCNRLDTRSVKGYLNVLGIVSTTDSSSDCSIVYLIALAFVND